MSETTPEPASDRDAALTALVGDGRGDGEATAGPDGEDVIDLGGNEVRRVAVDTFATMADLGGGRQHVTASRGQLVAVTAEDAARGEELGALVGVDEPTPAPGLPSDEELLGMTAEQLIAYAGQNPGEVGRVVALERTRDRPRRTVLGLAPGEDDGDDQAGDTGEQ